MNCLLRRVYLELSYARFGIVLLWSFLMFVSATILRLLFVCSQPPLAKVPDVGEVAVHFEVGTHTLLQRAAFWCGVYDRIILSEGQQQDHIAACHWEILKQTSNSSSY